MALTISALSSSIFNDKTMISQLSYGFCPVLRG
jgi:hypothetical protein